jgi:phenylacetic acid degradation operon negative regulatory protein
MPGSPVAAAGPRLPGAKPGSARTTLLNALGEFTVDGAASTPPTEVLVGVLAQCGIGRPAARQAVHRCARSGWISGIRSGRGSRWELTQVGRDLLSDGIARVQALGTEFTDWDGTWLVVTSTIPQDRRSVRDAFYRALRWHGFGSPVPGVWICAYPTRRLALDAAVRRCGLADSTISFTGTANGIGLSEVDLVGRAWDLDTMAQRYRDLVARFAPLAPQGPVETMVSLLALDDELQTVPTWDPGLPSALAPGWPGRASAARLLAMRARWLGPAREYWQHMNN